MRFFLNCTRKYTFLQAHATCRSQIAYECDFGILGPIYLPPHAVSIPRTEVPMESIIGVQVRRKEKATRKMGSKIIIIN